MKFMEVIRTISRFFDYLAMTPRSRPEIEFVFRSKTDAENFRQSIDAEQMQYLISARPPATHHQLLWFSKDQDGSESAGMKLMGEQITLRVKKDRRNGKDRRDR